MVDGNGSFDGETGGQFNAAVSTMLQNCIQKLADMQKDLESALVEDMRLVREGILSVERRANDPTSQVHDEDSGRPIDVPTMHDENSKINFELMQRIGYRSRIHFELVVGSVLSSEQNHDLVRLNPFLTPAKIRSLTKEVVGLLMRYIRSRQIVRCLNRARSLDSLLRDFLERGTTLACVDITNGRRTSDTISNVMVLEALSRTDWHGAKAGKELGKIVQLQDELCQQVRDDFLSEKGDEARTIDVDALVRGVVVAFHLVKFDVSAFGEFKNRGLEQFLRLAHLADKQCYYRGGKLYKPRSALVYLNGPSVTTSDGAAPAPRPLTLRASSVWENKDGALSGLIHMLKHSASGLAEEIVARRHYVKPERTLDPRFLVFEFITGFLLRKRQYELVTDFLSAHKRGESSVHQMIMGAGKTTVVGPLLALMLADGQRLVTQVCPGRCLK